MGLSGWQRFGVAANSLSFEASAECELSINGTRKKTIDGKISVARRMPIATRFEVVKGKQDGVGNYTPVNWICVFVYDGGESISVQGGNYDVKTSRAGSFLLPLPKPWKYSPAICRLLGISAANTDVGVYPDCRD